MDEPYRQAAYHALHEIKSLRIRKRIMLVLEALNGSAREKHISCVAREVLLDWEKENDDFSRIQI
jgi:hypothetical protein